MRPRGRTTDVTSVAFAGTRERLNGFTCCKVKQERVVFYTNSKLEAEVDRLVGRKDVRIVLVGDDAVNVGSWVQSAKLCFIFNQSHDLSRNQYQRAFVQLIQHLTLLVEFLYDQLVGSHAEATHVDLVGVA